MDFLLNIDVFSTAIKRDKKLCQTVEYKLFLMFCFIYFGYYLMLNFTLSDV